MTITISLMGEVLRDQDNNGKRNYANLIVSITQGKKNITNYHITNYAINARSLRHKSFIQEYQKFEAANRQYLEKREVKLKRNRVVFRSITETFETTRQLEEFLPSNEIRLPMVEAKKLAMKIDEQLAGLSVSFEDRMATELAKADDPVEKERKAGIGKDTAKINKGWGMF